MADRGLGRSARDVAVVAFDGVEDFGAFGELVAEMDADFLVTALDLTVDGLADVVEQAAAADGDFRLVMRMSGPE